MISQLRHFVRRVAHGIERAIRQPRSELDRWGRSVRFAYDLSRVGALQLKEDRAPEMAAALAFRTLFALAPVLVIGTILVRAIAGIDEFIRVVDSLLEAAGLSDVRMVFPTAGSTDEVVRTESLRDWLARVIEQTTHVTLSAVGWLGFAMIVYSAISLLRTIENSFNVIFRAPKSRPRTRSIPLYWFLLTVSPLAIGLASYLHGYVADVGESLAWNAWTTEWLRFAWNWTVTWLLVTMVFVLVPNTTVALRPALAGAFITVALLELGKLTIGKYLANSFGMSQLVTSLGLIPLFMFWVYLMWLAVLFGLQVSAILQQLDRRNLEEMERSAEAFNIIDPALIIPMMQIVARNFQLGRSTSITQLSREMRIAERLLDLVVRRLIAAEFLHRLEGADHLVCLARPPAEVPIAGLLEIAFDLSSELALYSRSPLIERLRTAQRALAADWTLAEGLTAEIAIP